MGDIHPAQDACPDCGRSRRTRYVARVLALRLAKITTLVVVAVAAWAGLLYGLHLLMRLFR